MVIFVPFLNKMDKIMSIFLVMIDFNLLSDNESSFPYLPSVIIQIAWDNNIFIDSLLIANSFFLLLSVFESFVSVFFFLFISMSRTLLSAVALSWIIFLCNCMVVLNGILSTDTPNIPGLNIIFSPLLVLIRTVKILGNFILISSDNFVFVFVFVFVFESSAFSSSFSSLENILVKRPHTVCAFSSLSLFKWDDTTFWNKFSIWFSCVVGCPLETTSATADAIKFTRFESWSTVGSWPNLVDFTTVVGGALETTSATADAIKFIRLESWYIVVDTTGVSCLVGCALETTSATADAIEFIKFGSWIMVEDAFILLCYNKLI